VSDERVPRLRSVENAEDWERVLAAAAHLQQIVPDAVLVGGSAAAMYVDHRFSRDDDHVVADLKDRFDRVLAELERIANWNTARIQRPVLILGQLDGVDTGVRNLIRVAPLETAVVETAYGKITLPTIDEMLRIKAWLTVKRNATRDYIDVAALSERIAADRGRDAVTTAILQMDALYPQQNGAAVSLQVARQLAEPKPFDFDAGEGLRIYRIRSPRWNEWSDVSARLEILGALLLRSFSRTNSSP